MPGSEAVNQLLDLDCLSSQPPGTQDGRRGGKLRRVVYIAAYMFPANFVMDAKIFVGDSDPMFRIDDRTGLTHFADPYTGFFNDMSQEEARPFLDNIGDTYYLQNGPCITKEDYKTAPLFYIQTAQDQAMPLERQVGISQGMPSVRLDTGHDPFISQAEIVAGILGRIADSV